MKHVCIMEHVPNVVNAKTYQSEINVRPHALKLAVAVARLENTKTRLVVVPVSTVWQESIRL
jgi:hypothetical protein